MAVSYKSSSRSGSTDEFITTLEVPVPSGSAANDVVIVGIGNWDDGSGFPDISAPSGFTQVDELISNLIRLRFYWKRLSSSENGNYTFTLSFQAWTMSTAILVSGALESGSPVDDYNFATNSSSTIVSTTVDTIEVDLLSHWCYVESGTALSSSPTGYTNVQTSNVQYLSYLEDAPVGSNTADGGSLDSSINHIALLVAIKPEPTGGLLMSIEDTARSNMLSELSLSEPQLLSNMDLARQVLDKDTQSTISDDGHPVGKEYIDYLRSLR